VKFDRNGAPLWLFDLEANSSQAGPAVDREGNIFVPVHVGLWENVLKKYNSAGELLWTVPTSESQNAQFTGVAVDADGNCTVSGHFSGTLSFGNFTMRSAQNLEAFVAKVSPTGEVLWALQSEGQGDPGQSLDRSDVRQPGVFVAGNGATYLGGVFSGTVQFGSTTLMYSSGLSSFQPFLARVTEPIPSIPLLIIGQGPAGKEVGWPAKALGYMLESTASLSSPEWKPVDSVPVLRGDGNVVTIDLKAAAEFFRLRKP
jgi:hypothetical protein